MRGHALGRSAVWLPLLCLLFSLLIYWPSLGLSWSLVDDWAHLQYSAQAINGLKTKGLGGFFGAIVVPEQNLFGPVFRAAVALQRLCFGLCPSAWHGMAIVFHAAILVALCALVGFAGGGAGAKVLAVLAFSFFGPQSVFPDFQTHYATFGRLFVSDTYVAVLSLWALVALACGIGGASRRTHVWLVAYFILVSAACLVKINALHLVGGCSLFLAMAAVASRLAKSSSRSLWLWLGATIVAATPGLLFFQPWKTEAIFAYQGVEIARGWRIYGPVARQYWEWTTESLGVLWIVACLTAFGRIGWHLVAVKQGHCVLDRRILIRLLLALCFAAGFILQSKWSIALPRYMVVFSPYLCLLFAIEMAAGLDWLGRRLRPGGLGRLWVGHFAIGAAGVAMWLWPDYLDIGYSAFRPAWTGFWALLLVAVGSCGMVQLAQDSSWRGLAWARRVPMWAVAGALFWQGAVQGLYTYDSAANYYARERLNNRLLLAARALGKGLTEGQRGTIYTNIEGAELGSAQELARRVFGVESVRIEPFPYDQRARLGANDRIVIRHDYNLLGHTHIPPFAGGRPVFALFPPDQPDGALAVGPGETLQRPVSVPQDFAISLVGLNADPLSWPSSLTIRVLAESGAREPGPKEIARFEGRSALRGRLGAQIQALEQPFILPKEVQAIRLRCESWANGFPPRLRSPARGDRIVMGGISYDTPSGRVKRAAPIYFWGAPAAIPAHRLLERYAQPVQTALLASPTHILRLHRQHVLSWKGRLPSSLRLMRYQYALELYGPSSQGQAFGNG